MASWKSIAIREKTCQGERIRFLTKTFIFDFILYSDMTLLVLSQRVILFISHTPYAQSILAN